VSRSAFLVLALSLVLDSLESLLLPGVITETEECAGLVDLLPPGFFSNFEACREAPPFFSDPALVEEPPPDDEPLDDDDASRDEFPLLLPRCCSSVFFSAALSCFSLSSRLEAAAEGRDGDALAFGLAMNVGGAIGLPGGTPDAMMFRCSASSAFCTLSASL